MIGGKYPCERFPPRRFAAAIVLLAVWFLSLRPAVDSDYGWHVSNGRHLWDGVLLGGRDVYSWTAAGATWVDAEWLSELSMSLIHDTLGPTANSVLSATVVAVAFALVALRLRRRNVSWLTTLITITVGFAGSIASLGVRPQMLELLFCATTLLLIDEWVVRRNVGAVRLSLAGAAGAVLWANSHGSFPLLLLFLASTSLGLLLSRRSQWLSAAIATAVTSLAFVLNPWGLGIYRFATQSITSPTTRLLIQEWRAPNLTSLSSLPLCIELGLIVVALAIAGSELLNRVNRTVVTSSGRPGSATLAVSPADVLIAVAVSVLALQSGRHGMLLGVCGAPVIAFSLEAMLVPIRKKFRGAVRFPPAPQSESEIRTRELINLTAAAGVALAFALVGWRIVSPAAQQRALAVKYPVGLLQPLDSAKRLSPCLLNEYTWGGFLIESGRIPVFIDGRSEVYGDVQLARYGAIIHLRPGWLSRIDSLGVDLVLMPRSAPLSAALVHAGWNEIARDTVGVLLSNPRANAGKLTTGCQPLEARTRAPE